MNDKKTNAAFKEVTENWFDYFGGIGMIKLDGTFCSDELREIARVLDEMNRENSQNGKL